MSEKVYPTPGKALMKHVTGNPDLTPEQYFGIGRAVALDIFKLGVIHDPSAKVIDIGCGCGRIAQFLLPMLEPTKGQYIGYDTWADGPAWATENLSTIHPHGQFIHLGETSQYEASTAHAFGVPAGSQDAVIAISLFSHLRKEAANQCLSEISKALRPGGKAYLTFLASKERFREWFPDLACPEDDYGIYYVKPGSEDSFVEERVLASLFEANSLAIKEKLYGTFRGDRFRGRGLAGYQDVFVAERK